MIDWDKANEALADYWLAVSVKDEESANNAHIAYVNALYGH